MGMLYNFESGMTLSISLALSLRNVVQIFEIYCILLKGNWTYLQNIEGNIAQVAPRIVQLLSLVPAMV